MCAQTNQLPSTILLPKHDEPRSIWSTTWFYQRRKPSPTCDKHLPMLGHTTDLTVQDSVPALARTTSSQAPGRQCPPCAASREKKATPERFLAPPGKLQPLQCFLLPLCPSAPLSKIDPSNQYERFPVLQDRRESRHCQLWLGMSLQSLMGPELTVELRARTPSFLAKAPD